MSTLTIDIPAEVLRQLEEEARRTGKSPEALTREFLETALHTREKAGASSSSNEIEARFRQNLTYFEREKQTLQERYGDQFVAIWEERVVDHDADRSQLASRVYSRFGFVPVCIDQPSMSPARFYISSPTLG